jgi:HK97 family phage prohead protease
VIDLRVRAVALDDATVRGRTVEAYAAVFDIPAEVVDQDGHYREIIDPKAFNKTISDNARRGWPVFYNHGMTPHGTPSDRWSTPLGVPEEVRVDGRGLYTRTRFAETPDADQILELIRNGAVSGYSFTGRFVRSDPARRRSSPLLRPSTDGTLRTVRRLEATLVEFGPTATPVHQAAEILGVRAARLHSVSSEDTSGPFERDTSGPSDTGTLRVAVDTETVRSRSSRDLRVAAILRKKI